MPTADVACTRCCSAIKYYVVTSIILGIKVLFYRERVNGERPIYCVSDKSALDALARRCILLLHLQVASTSRRDLPFLERSDFRFYCFIEVTCNLITLLLSLTNPKCTTRLLSLLYTFVMSRPLRRFFLCPDEVTSSFTAFDYNYCSLTSYFVFTVSRHNKMPLLWDLAYE